MKRALKFLVAGVFLGNIAVSPVFAAVTTYADRATWQAAAGSATTIGFSATDNGAPLSNPPADVAIGSVTLQGVTFYGIRSSFNEFVYAPPADFRAVLPPNTTAIAFDAAPYFDEPGTYTITVIAGGVAQTFQMPAGRVPNLADVIGLTSTAPIESVAISLDSSLLKVDNFAFVAPASVATQIDVKPGSGNSRINPRSEGVIPVALLSSSTFNAGALNWQSLRFGATGTEAALDGYSNSDVNGDGRPDVVLRFRTSDTGIGCNTTSATLTGTTAAGVPFSASDAVTIVGCPKPSKAK